MTAIFANLVACAVMAILSLNCRICSVMLWISACELSEKRMNSWNVLFCPMSVLSYFLSLWRVAVISLCWSSCLAAR